MKKIHNYFVNYKPNEKEVEWVKYFLGSTGCLPFDIEQVKSREDFIEMVKKNINHYEESTKETLHFLEKKEY